MNENFTENTMIHERTFKSGDEKLSGQYLNKSEPYSIQIHRL